MMMIEGIGCWKKTLDPLFPNFPNLTGCSLSFNKRQRKSPLLFLIIESQGEREIDIREREREREQWVGEERKELPLYSA
jgi:hypothetical protein